MAKGQKKSADKVIDAEFFNIGATAKMTGAQYWEWRTTVEEMLHAKSKANIAQLKKQVLDLQAIELNLKARLEAFVVKDATNHKEEVASDYQDFRKKLETQLGVSIENCSIDPINFEVIPLKQEEA